MPAPFDHYYRWLGIPPDEQPPNHYRLLGVAVFEEDPEIISHAADRQMGHVRTFQTGRNSARSQQLLNEIAAARLCLLDPVRREAYDRQLRETIGGRVELDEDGAAFRDYLLEDLLANARTGQVFRARHRFMNREVAIKVLSSQRPDWEHLAPHFRRKVRLLARLNHPNLVSAYDAGERDGTLFLIMEYVPGESLAERITKPPALSETEVADLGRQAARGLAHAHAQGCVHRNVKPDNLLISTRGVVKVIGFASAWWPEDAGGPEWHVEQPRFVGTPDYMAPEQAVDSRCVDPRADVYALGCTLYTAATRRFPYAGATVTDKLRAHRTQPPPLLRALRADLSPGLEAIVKRMMAKRRQDRFRSMIEVAEALATLLD